MSELTVGLALEQTLKLKMRAQLIGRAFSAITSSISSNARLTKRVDMSRLPEIIKAGIIDDQLITSINIYVDKGERDHVGVIHLRVDWSKGGVVNIETKDSAAQLGVRDLAARADEFATEIIGRLAPICADPRISGVYWTINTRVIAEKKIAVNVFKEKYGLADIPEADRKAIARLNYRLREEAKKTPGIRLSVDAIDEMEAVLRFLNGYGG